MYDDCRRISILERVGTGILLVVVVISFAFDTAWNQIISFFKRK